MTYLIINSKFLYIYFFSFITNTIPTILNAAIPTIATTAISPVFVTSNINVSPLFSSTVNSSPVISSSNSYPSGALISINLYVPYGTFSIIYSPSSFVSPFSTKYTFSPF